MTIDDCRHFYAEEVRIAAGVNSPALVEAFAQVPREKFMGPPPWQIASPELASMAFLGLRGEGYLTTEDPRDLYHNVLVALDADRHLNNGQPSALARWLDALELISGDKVYHLGCGVGYYTAIMAEIVGARGRVAASEVDASLAARARDNLASYPTVSVHAGDGAAFDSGICDAIFINAGVTHPHPLWLARLREGGRLVLPLTSSMAIANVGTGVMAKITRRETDADSGEESERQIPFMKGYTVFNVEQVEGLPPHFYAKAAPPRACGNILRRDRRECHPWRQSRLLCFLDRQHTHALHRPVQERGQLLRHARA